ncbi:MAG: hypothetical protein ABUT39_06075 [Acidobacteriota bacterium]
MRSQEPRRAARRRDPQRAGETAAPLLRGIDLVELLWMYQGSMATRVFSEGNQEYLALMIDASQRLVRALAEAPRSPLLPRSRVAALVDLVEGQTPANASGNASEAVPILSGLRSRDQRAQAAALYLRGPLPPLPDDYERVVVYFGSAMGLGDQINFFQLLEALARHCRKARFLVYTLYPGLWPRLLPGAGEVSYRDDPLLPFFDLNRPAAEDRRERKELVITADFEVFNLHLHTVAQRPQRDILEISLGRMAAWLNGGRSPWIRLESFLASSDNNYVFMHGLASRLAPKAGRAVWEPVREPRPPRTPRTPRPPQPQRTLLLNPFTSKKLPFTAELWAEGLREVRTRLRGRIPFEVLVYPGVERSTSDFAEEIRDRLSEEDPIAVRLLAAAGEPLTPHNALSALLDELGRVDLCITADTFTSHLVPMYRVPTVVVAYSHFQKFWVPSRWSFNCPVERMRDHGLSLVARILTLLESSSPRAQARRQKAAALLRATDEAARGEPSVRALVRLEAALAGVFRGLDSAFPAYEETQRWLLLWTRLTAAHQREPGTEEGLLSYVRLWQESEAFRLLAVGV